MFHKVLSVDSGKKPSELKEVTIGAPRATNSAHPQMIRFPFLKSRISPKDLPPSMLSMDSACTFIDMSPSVMCIVDDDCGIRSFNAAFKRMIFIERPHVGKRLLNLVDAIASEDIEKFIADQLTCKEIGSQESRGEYSTRIPSRDNSDPKTTSYCWTIAWTPSRTFGVVTGAPVFSQASMLSKAIDEVALKAFGKEAKWAQPNGDDKSRRRSSINLTRNLTRILESVEAKVKQADEAVISALSESLNKKRVFVRHINHEIRTPLNVVMAGLDFLSTSHGDQIPELREMVREIKSACAVAIEILNDLLAYERIDSDTLTLQKSSLDIAKIVRGVGAMFEIQAKYSDIQLKIEDTVNQDFIIVDADEVKLSQVLRNLVGNAFKFTPSGGKVELRMLLVEESNRVRIEVHDTGPGIDKVERGQLFAKAVVYDEKELQSEQGSGLGMRVSQKIIDLHGGIIGVDTTWDGPGSKFYIELPVVQTRQSVMRVEGNVYNLVDCCT